MRRAKKQPPPNILHLRLVDDFQWVWKHAWSVRFNILAAIFSAATAGIGVLTAYQVVLPIGPITLAVSAGVCAFGASAMALASRFVKQDRPDPDGSE